VFGGDNRLSVTEGAKATVRLTQLSHGAGCACKIGPADLQEIVGGLPRSSDPALLVGFETADDAGVYLVNDELALVQSVDFFTPIVDDPYDFGRIAAANALSDLYAMGARPLTALSLIAYSLERLGGESLAEILRGGTEVASEAGVAVIGGHSIDDPEPKYGMAVTGVAHPEQIVRNSTARPDDVLFLTKPIGGGVISTAAKRGKAAPELIARCTEVMTMLNGAAAEAALSVGPSAMTDVSGFGLLGHLRELAAASGVAARIDAAAVPVIDGALDLLDGDGSLPGGTRRNRAFVEPITRFEDSVPEERRAVLFDAMTSGGLLVATDRDRAGEMEAALGAVAPAQARIGELREGEAGTIAVE
jgi:selenide,water dikinase